MLFINLEIIMELIGYNIWTDCDENRLVYYNDVSATTLDDDIKFNTRESYIVNEFAEVEVYKSNYKKEKIAESIREHYHLSKEEERELFTKLFVREYLCKKEKNVNLSLTNYLSQNKMFSSAALFNSLDKLNASTFFEDFASDELKNDRNFAKAILQLDGSYILCMGQKIKNSEEMMRLAISNDETPDVISFSKSNSMLLSDSKVALAYFSKLEKNQGSKFSADTVYEKIFKQENGAYPKTVFKDDEQSAWMRDPFFLPRLCQFNVKYQNLIENGDISPLGNKDSKVMVKTLQNKD
mgnify:CR=1 FL=1